MSIFTPNQLFIRNSKTINLMKKYYLFIALAMVAGMTVSCKNNKKAEADAEVVEAAKTILADDVLATLDEYAQACNEEAGKTSVSETISSALTEEEKLIKPDYLLEADQVNALITKSQKAAAIAILSLERPIRQAYGLSTKETDEAAARLAAELNHPVFDNDTNQTLSENAKKAYETYKEKGNIAGFWQFNLALQVEADYLISKNADVIFRNLTEENYASLTKKFSMITAAVKTLAEYDPEVKQAWDAFNAGGEIVTNLSKESIEYGKNFFIERTDVHAARRAALLK